MGKTDREGVRGVGCCALSLYSTALPFEMRHSAEPLQRGCKKKRNFKIRERCASKDSAKDHLLQDHASSLCHD